MSTLKNNLSLLEKSDSIPVQYKKQKLDTIPLDNNESIEILPPNTFSKLEETIETLEVPDENGEQNYTILEQQQQVKEETLDILNKNYLNPEFITRFCFAFKKNQTFTDDTSQATVYNLPFSVA